MSDSLPTDPHHPAAPHLPLVAELPLVDQPGGTDVDLRTQVIRFIATGALSAVVDFGIYWFLSSVCGILLPVAKSISFICGTTTAYLINRRWTFRAEPSRGRFAAVVALYAVTFAAQVGINQVMYDTISPHPWRKLAAFVVAQGVATVINFIVQRAVIFKIR